MDILKQIAIVFGFAYGGYFLANGLSIPLPASVIGLLLLLGGLRTKAISEKSIGVVAHFLSVNMAFFFLPAAVEILESYARVRPVLAKLIFVCVVSTLLAFFASYGAVCLLQRFLRRGKGER